MDTDDEIYDHHSKQLKNGHGNYDINDNDINEQDDDDLDDGLSGDRIVPTIENNINFNEMLYYESGSFVVEFNDGYSFRNLIEYLKITNIKGNLCFSKNAIRYQQQDNNNITFNDIEINTFELPFYQFNSQSEEIIVGINITDLRAITRTIGKKDSVRLFKEADEPSLYIQIISSNNQGGGLNMIRTQQIEVRKYKFDHYCKSEDNPTCTIAISNFTRMCASMTAVKPTVVTMYGFEHGLIMGGRVKGDILGKIEKFGITDEDIDIMNFPLYNKLNNSRGNESHMSNGEQMKTISYNQGNGGGGGTIPKPKLVVTSANSDENMDDTEESPSYPILIQIRSNIIKALAKLNNLSPNSTIKFYIEQNKPLKMVCKIGYYGTLRIYIKSDDEC